ncbi:undecaprenyl-phosphate galactose phosphotransferase WbaP [Blastopirellula marina]|uniref:Undecaprenyl-phosphate galactose phosphotransferase WbaP n=2 Tax=Blastopirellula marina TaxID=124 RepID=A0A2S8GLV9_9BACT|nr:undecaprenyl-phosphate galactose phosphotransferase WbaP [Blastopirellula marina]
MANEGSVALAPERIESRVSAPLVSERHLYRAEPHGASISNGMEEAMARRLADLSLKQSFLFGLPLMAVDFAFMWLTVFCVGYLEAMWLAPPYAGVSFTIANLASSLLVLVAYCSGLYPAIGMTSVIEFRNLVKAAGVSMVACSSIAFFAGTQSDVLFYLVLGIVSLPILLFVLPSARFVVRSFMTRFSWWGAPTLIYASPTHARYLVGHLRSMAERGLRPAGILISSDQYWDAHSKDIGYPVFDVRDATASALGLNATWVLCSEDHDGQNSFEIPPSLDLIPHRIVLSQKNPVGLWGERQCIGLGGGVRLQSRCPDTFRCMVKRAFDLFVAITALTLLSPFLVAIILLIRLGSPGPVFYGQKRVGRFGSEFTAWKFRTMRVNADQFLEECLQNNKALREEWEATHKLKSDPRVTWVGRFLRKTSLDELPQLWNILVGQMSVVGPRPIVNSEQYDRTYIVDYPNAYAAYVSVRPGLTGMWQISCRNRGTYEMRIHWDMYYIHNWSLWLDLYITLRTVRTVFLREGAY